jgi:hypothetical protein
MRRDKAGRRLTLLSAAERRYCEPLLRGFAERHPEIEVDFVFGISTDLHRRYLQEAASGGTTSDLIWSSAMDQVMDLVLNGHAQPHGVRHALPANAAYRDLAVATTCEPLFTLCRDTSRPAGSPADIATLIAVDPQRYRGAIAVPDIETNGLGYLAMLWWSEDPAFDDFLDALATCQPRAVGSAPALIAAMADGAETRASSPWCLCVARRCRRPIAAHCTVVDARDGGRARGVHSPPRREPGSRIGLPRLSAVVRRAGGGRRSRLVSDRSAAGFSPRTDPA